MKKITMLVLGLAAMAAGVTAQEVLAPLAPPTPTVYQARLTPAETQRALTNLASIIQLPSNIPASSIRSVSATVGTNGTLVTVRVNISTNNP